MHSSRSAKILDALHAHLKASATIPPAWAAEHERHLPDAWASSDSAERMLRIAAHLVSHEALVLAACAVARRALRYVPAPESAPAGALDVAERWARGEATIDEVVEASTRAEATASAAHARANALSPRAKARATAFDLATAATACATAARVASAIDVAAREVAAHDTVYAVKSLPEAMAAALAVVVREHVPAPTIAQLGARPR